ncbi:V-type H+-transporting ATPase 21kDa proteolipid subunit [Nematocida displodere]|uniref:V-type H+-transporting ATPase 21kDa proteolipid subunit n=1 Tax=Nematocida displodere TaxID=1805483 RepID=A0A177EAR3_9MICR|nr:V-type H+-transporting ATPase 21kDa proteolipid subunit [Nematocida displodere]
MAEEYERSFLQKITRTEVALLASLVLIGPFYRAFSHVLTISPLTPAFVGLFAPVVLNTLGTTIGTAVIGKSISGAAVKNPGIMMKSLVGIVICEANLIFSLLSFSILKDKAITIDITGGVGKRQVLDSWTILASGLVCGLCGMISSLGSSVVNAASSIAIAGNSRLFSKLVTLQLIISGVGVLGLVISLIILRLYSDSE